MKDKKILLHKFTSLFLAILMLVQIHLGSFNVFALDDGNQTTTESTESTITSETSDKLSSTTEENTSSEIPSNDIGIISVEGDEETESVDNWELSVIFYDSTVNNGTTPLTEINWDASDGGYGWGEKRTITVQINYKNTNTVTSYSPGTLKLTIPRLTSPQEGEGTPQWESSVVIGANDSTHTGYDWTTVSNSNYAVHTFQNANTILKDSNFEGSLQIKYTIQPLKETTNTSQSYCLERYDDSCIHNYTKTLQATLENIMSSNEITLNYTRTYIHKWEKTTYTIFQDYFRISSYDGLGTNPSDYYWIKYRFQNNRTLPENDELAIYASPLIYRITLPEGCIAYDNSLNVITPDDNNTFSFTGTTYYYVGYPKSDFSANMSITETTYLYGIYANVSSVKLFYA